MGMKRLGVAVVIRDGYFCAIGGSDGPCPLSTGKRKYRDIRFIMNPCYFRIVERYDPKANKWSSVSSMDTRRKHFGCTVYN